MIATLSAPVATVLAAFLAAVVAVIGWFVAKWREDRTRRLEVDLRYMERQVEEFYGPLFNLINQIFAAENIQFALLNNDDGSPRKLTPEHREKIEKFFWNEWFSPLHNQVIQVLKTKLHLIDSAQIPQSFYAYLRHATQQRAQLALWQEHGVPTDYVKGIDWPDGFYPEVEGGLKQILRRYDRELHTLRAQQK